MKVNEKVKLKNPGQMAVKTSKGRRSGKEEHENGRTPENIKYLYPRQTQCKGATTLKGQ